MFAGRSGEFVCGYWCLKSEYITLDPEVKTFVNSILAYMYIVI